ncbi:uncharacterized protein LOC131050155 isoform X1 [Cryptomeria japonica]|uniref:uncharacterized protein LOC131050155 isoform X1 n=1 Tax=Cryptomeria japonica TaxID=3369 RepID=UPI0027DA1286|nr:uncharacterized protein LOC131050155 isoform X1 [Cryptomeria japonica]
MLQTGAMPIIPPCADVTRGKKNKLCFQWKKASNIRPYSFAAAQTALTFEEKNIGGDVQDNWWPGYSEDEKEIDPKEAQRRMKISKSNMGKPPWNKGKKHSPEMLALISERTKQALQNPKTRLKMSRAGYARAASESEERKKEISAIQSRAWEVRRKRSVLQQICMVEWKESIAESARRGGDGEDELQWDSCYILREAIHQEWSRKNVMTGTEKSKRLRRPGHRRPYKVPRPDTKLQRKNVMTGMEKSKRLRRPGHLQPYKDPHLDTKLQTIKRIRADRAAQELEKRLAKGRAMLLIAEAVEAAKALESAATVNTLVQDSLLEIRRLIDEAIHSMEIAESGKSTYSFMLERDFSKPTYKDTHFMDRSEVADNVMPDTADNYGICQSSLSKSRKNCENILLACKSETNIKKLIP